MPNEKFMARFESVSAAADFLGNGAIEINRYEPEIFDEVVRSSVFLNRVEAKPATGHPHRYFEQLAIGTAAFNDPRTLTPTSTGPTRVERTAFIKAITVQTNLSLFDVDVTKQQGQFSYLEAKDIQDAVNAILRLEAAAVWNGNDTSLANPTTQQYMGLLNQITQTATIGNGSSIVDGLKAQVATMLARTDFDAEPTAIYVNPKLADYIARECKAMGLVLDTVEVKAGVKVSAIQTEAGLLPLISDRWLPYTNASGYGFSAPPSGFNNYFAVLVTERAIEMPFIDGGQGNPKPRIFQLGLMAGLQGQYVAVHFNSIVAKGPSYAHSIVAIVRP